MTHEDMERAIEFLIDHHAKVEAKIDRLTESVQSMQSEMRGGFENLIIANEVTRDLAQQVARLAIETKGRVDKLEERTS